MTTTSAHDIAAGVAAGKISARTIVDEHLARIDARESDIHAFNMVTADAARSHADQIDADVKAGRPPMALTPHVRRAFCKVGSHPMTPQLCHVFVQQVRLWWAKQTWMNSRWVHQLRTPHLVPHVIH
jgi:hypothetical protein